MVSKAGVENSTYPLVTDGQCRMRITGTRPMGGFQFGRHVSESGIFVRLEV